MKLYDAGIDLHKSQQAGDTSPLYWLGKLIASRFDAGELVGKQGRVEIYTLSENGKHSVFAWVKIAPADGVDLFLGMASEFVNSNEVYDVWV
jgi:hypothetical protein